MYSRVMILTGAGASTALGRDKPLAMMSEWATSLVEELGYAAELLGLTPSMEGDKFEAALGRFLRFAEALPTVEPLHKLGGMQSLIGDGTQVQTVLDSRAWLNIATQNVNAIRRVVWHNLYEQFTMDRVDEEKAYRSYKRLHDLIRNSLRRDDQDPIFLVHATTNFDRAIEAAIDLESERVNPNIVSKDGFVSTFAGRRPQWAPNTLESADHDGIIPVLHLHGAVGWYFTEDGTIQSRPSDETIDDRLTPALLLPDDTKSVPGFPPPLQEMWSTFRRQLANCSHVLVLGHSLHDAHLVEELGESGKPIAAVAYAPRINGHYDALASKDATALSGALPDVKLIGGNFGQGAKWSDVDTAELKLWLRDPTRK